VTAYRMVTDKYPPLTQPGELGAEVWREDGKGPRPPRELNPRVSAELDALIRQLLAIAPEERFGGHARETAEALEQAARSAGPEADSPLFLLANGRVVGCRSPGEVQLAEQEDAAAREEQTQQRTEGRAQAAQVSRRPALAPAWAVGCVVVLLGAVLTLLAVRGSSRMPTGVKADASVAVGDSARSASTATQEPASVGAKASPVTQPMPENPLPGQRKPPCRYTWELVIRGGCWIRVADAHPPCEGYVYDLNGVCYAPMYSAGRKPTSDPP
jgi:hypothetical protein